MNPERPRLLRASYGWATSGNPGVYRAVNGANPVPGALHGGTVVGGNLIDPSCGTFNDVTDFGAPINNPSGIVRPGNNCYVNYSTQWPLASGKRESNFFQNLNYELSSGVRLNAQMSIANRASDSHQTLTYQLNGNNRNGLVVPANHPANPYGTDVVPYEWRPFMWAGTLPSYADAATGARLNKYNTLIQRYKVGASFDLTSTWTANTAFSYQRSHTHTRQNSINITNLQAALIGQGGPGGNEWFNPFGSADVRSPYYQTGVTGNSQELVDWIAPSIRYRTGKNELTVFELNATGDLIELPAGMAQMAVGYQMRDQAEEDYAHPLSKIGQNYNASIADSWPVDRRYGSTVQAAYMELEVPLAETIDAQIAVRHERFTTFGMSTTTPKVALRWEILPTLALRGSIGESFLAPTPANARPFDPNEGCGEIFFGSDPLTGGVLNGGATCSSGNPNLKPETSDIWNVGFTWEPTDNWTVSMDYQSIEYTDRIRTLSTTDIVAIEFEEMLKAIGSTPATYNSAPGSATRAAADAWVAAGGTPRARITRDPATQRVMRVVSQAQNVSSVWVDLVDARVRYSFDTANWGSFTTTVSGTYNTKYEYDGGKGVIVDALGKQNDTTGIVGPVPKLKAQARLGWYLDNHSASFTWNHQDAVDFDAIVQNALTGTPPPSDGKVRAWTVANAQYTYLFDSYLNSDISVSLGVNNLFDREPQRLPMLGGFASRLQSPWGRQFYVSLEWEPRM
jgi:outer membrane receptor protein involved in Fe transport